MNVTIGGILIGLALISFGLAAFGATAKGITFYPLGWSFVMAAWLCGAAPLFGVR
jgi:hypothetical protein